MARKKRKKNKYKYEISLITSFIILILAYFFGLDKGKVEYDDIPKIEINEQVTVKEFVRNKKEINSINLEDFKLNISKKKLESILEYKKYMGTINFIDDLNNIPRITSKDIQELKKYFIDTRKKVYREHNINEMKIISLKYLGFTNFEIKKITTYRKKKKFDDMIELEKVVGRVLDNMNIVFK